PMKSRKSFTTWLKIGLSARKEVVRPWIAAASAAPRALGVHVPVKDASRRHVVDQLHGAEFDDPVPG
ncbi:hypothetical protein CNY89_30750, partial [Amaricoccus sp. HAR-UPW-R2A-40]